MTGTDMNRCPTRSQLSQLLFDELSADEEAAISLHLESCTACVKVMDELTSDDSHSLDSADSGYLRSPDVESMIAASTGPKFVRVEDRSGMPNEELVRLRRLLPAVAQREATASGSNHPEIPGYRIEAEIGRGGMGVVYRARQSQLNRPVALKMILNSQFATQEQVVRFLAEAQTCAAIRHPGIVQIYEVGQLRGVPFFSMELLQEGTLADYVTRHQITPRDAAAIVEDLARAIHAAHVHGVVHRDLKPANIMLQNVDSGTSQTGVKTRTTTSMLRTQASPLAPKITDFGLARRFDIESNLTQAGAMLGTPDYMAPEQVEPGRHHIGPPTDLYSLGAILYFLLTGQPPFRTSTLMETLEAVKTREAISPSRINKAVPRDLAIICLHCLEKHPGQRYATAEALGEDLHRFLLRQPISARPVSDFERVQKWAVRNPGIATLTAALLATVFSALVLVTWQWTRAVEASNRESRRADSEAAAKKAEAVARRESQVLSASYSLDHGILACRAGKSRDGLLSMVRALEMLPDDQPELEFAIRANIHGWRRQICKAEFHTSRGTPYTAVAFSPDGRTVLVGDWGNAMGETGPAQIQLLAVDCWKESPIWTVDHPGAVWSVAFSPDGQRVAIGGFNGTAIVLDSATGKPLTAPLLHDGRVYAVAFSPDGKTLAAAGHVTSPPEIVSRDQPLGPGLAGELRLWDVMNGALIGEPVVTPFGIHCLAWHPSGQSIGIGGLNVAVKDSGAAGMVQIFDVGTHQLSGAKLSHPDGVGAIAFSPDAPQLVTGCRDGFIRFWDHKTGKVDPAPQYQTRTINGLAFTRDAQLLAVASGHHEPGTRLGTGEVHLWDAANRADVFELPFERLGAQSQKMHAVAFGDNDRRLAGVSEHGRAWLWTLPAPVTPVREWKFSQRTDVYHSPNGKRLLLNVLPPALRGFNEQPCEFHLIDSTNGRTIATLPHPTVSWARFSPDNRFFATWGYTSDKVAAKVGLWNAESGAAIPLPAEFPLSLKTLNFVGNGTVLQTVSVEGQLRSWDLATLQPLGAASSCFNASDLVMAFNPVGSRALVSNASGTQLIQLPDGKVISQLTSEKSRSGGFTNDGSTVYASLNSDDAVALRWNATDGSPRSDVIPKSQRYAPGSFGTGDELGIDLCSKEYPRAADANSPLIHNQPAALHPSGLYYVTIEGGVSTEIHFWSHTSKPLGPPLPHDRLHRVQFNPNGKSLMTCSHDGTVLQWPVPIAATESVEQLREECMALY